MTKLLEQTIEEARKLWEVDQDLAAMQLIRFVAEKDELQLSDEQVEEVQRRRKVKNPKTLTMAQLDERLKRLSVLRLVIRHEAADDSEEFFSIGRQRQY